MNDTAHKPEASGAAKPAPYNGDSGGGVMTPPYNTGFWRHFFYFIVLFSNNTLQT